MGKLLLELVNDEVILRSKSNVKVTRKETTKKIVSSHVFAKSGSIYIKATPK